MLNAKHRPPTGCASRALCTAPCAFPCCIKQNQKGSRLWRAGSYDSPTLMPMSHSFASSYLCSTRQLEAARVALVKDPPL